MDRRGRAAPQQPQRPTALTPFSARTGETPCESRHDLCVAGLSATTLEIEDLAATHAAESAQIQLTTSMASASSLARSRTWIGSWCAARFRT